MSRAAQRLLCTVARQVEVHASGMMTPGASLLAQRTCAQTAGGAGTSVSGRWRCVSWRMLVECPTALLAHSTVKFQPQGGAT